MSRPRVLASFGAGVFSLVFALIAAACSFAYPLSGYSSGGPDNGGEGGASSSGNEGGISSEGGNDGSSSSSSGAPPLLFWASKNTIQSRRFIPASNTWTPAVTATTKVIDDDNRIISWVVPKRRGDGPTILGVYSSLPDKSQGKLQVFETTDGVTLKPAFDSSDFVATPSGGTPARRAFDIAFEGASGRAVAIYGGANPFMPKVRVRSADGNWSSEAGIGASSPNDVAFLWHELVARGPGFDDLVLLSIDRANRFYACRWIPSANKFAEPELLADPIEDDNFRAFAGAFESKSGDLLITWAAAGRMNFVTAKPNEPVPTRARTRALMAASTGVVSLVPDPTSDRIAMSMLEIVCSASTCDDFSTWLWNGDDFVGSLTTVDTDITESFGERDGSHPIGIAWSDGDAIAPYFRNGRNGGGGFRWSRYRSDSRIWSVSEPDVAVSPPISSAKASFVPFRSPGSSSNVVFVVSDEKGGLWAKRFDGKTWSDTEGGSPLGIDLPTARGVAFGVDSF